MKFIVTENQKMGIQQKIYNFVEDLMPDDFYIEYYKNFEDVRNPKKLSDIDSFELIDDIHVVFRIHLPNFKSFRPGFEVDKLPMLKMTPKYKNLLNDLFGNMWHSEIKKWFELNIMDKLPEPVEIKTIE